MHGATGSPSDLSRLPFCASRCVCPKTDQLVPEPFDGCPRQVPFHRHRFQVVYRRWFCRLPVVPGPRITAMRIYLQTCSASRYETTRSMLSTTKDILPFDPLPPCFPQLPQDDLLNSGSAYFNGPRTFLLVENATLHLDNLSWMWSTSGSVFSADTSAHTECGRCLEPQMSIPYLPSIATIDWVAIEHDCCQAARR